MFTYIYISSHTRYHCNFIVSPSKQSGRIKSFQNSIKRTHGNTNTSTRKNLESYLGL